MQQMDSKYWSFVESAYQGCRSLYSCSADKTCIVWDIKANAVQRRFREHNGIVNSCHPARRGPEILATASDDTTVKVCCFSLLFSLLTNVGLGY